MAITVILDMQIHAELVDEFITRLMENMPDTLSYEGCDYVDVYRAAGDANRVVLIEGWVSEDAFAGYGAWRAERGDAAEFVKYYATTPVLTKLVPSE